MNAHMNYNPMLIQAAHGNEGRSLILHADGQMWIVDTASCHRGDFTGMVAVCKSSAEHFASAVAKGVDFVIQCCDRK